MSDLSMQDVSNALTNNYMLVTVSISSWDAKVADKKVATETAASHGAQEGAVRVTKQLLVGADAEHKALLAAQNAVRTFAYRKTIPYAKGGDDGNKRGPRVLPVADTLDFMAELKPLNLAYKQALGDFKAVYSARVATARANLGSMDDAGKYPDPSILDDLFSVRVDFEPVPAITSFKNLSLPVQVAEALGERLAARQQSALQAGLLDLRERIAQELARIVGQLTKVSQGEKTSLFKSMQTNIAGLRDLLTSTLPLFGAEADSPAMAVLRERLDVLASTSVDQYKASLPVARASLSAAQAAGEALDEIQWF